MKLINFLVDEKSYRQSCMVCTVHTRMVFHVSCCVIWPPAILAVWVRKNYFLSLKRGSLGYDLDYLRYRGKLEGVSKRGTQYPKYPNFKRPISQYPNFKGPISQYPNFEPTCSSSRLLLGNIPISQICHWYPNIPISVSQYPKFRLKMSDIPISQFVLYTPMGGQAT